MEKSVSLFNLCNLENVFQKNLRTGMARECIFRASGDLRFKNFPQPWWQKGGGGIPRCNQSAQKNSGFVTADGALLLGDSKKLSTRRLFQKVCLAWKLSPIINR